MPVACGRRHTGRFEQQKRLLLRRALACRNKAEWTAITICSDQHNHVLLGKREPATPRVQCPRGVVERAVAQNVLLKLVDAVGIIQAGDPQPLTGTDMFHRPHPLVWTDARRDGGSAL